MQQPCPKLAFAFAFAAISIGSLRAEIPIPDALIYGTIHGLLPGIPASRVEAKVLRGGDEVFSLQGEIVDDDGSPLYVLRVPLRTNIGAPGSDDGAREGDVLTALRIDGRPVDFENVSLSSGLARRIDVEVESDGSLSYFRGDCDLNGGLEITDSIFLLSYLFAGGRTPSCIQACDVDDNSSVEITDPIALLQHLFLGAPPPADPTGACLIDLDPSPLSCEETCI